MIRVSSKQVLIDFEGCKLDTWLMSHFQILLIFQFESESGAISGKTCMVYKPKCSKCLSFAVKTFEVCPGYQMKYKYVGKYPILIE